MRRPSVLCGFLAGAAVLIAACGGGGSTVVRPPGTTGSTGAPTSTTLPSPTASPPAGSQAVSVSQAAGLASGQHITVTGTGFSPGQLLVVTECADKGDATGQGDCNLSGVVTASSDTGGRVQADLVVLKGPFGANQVVCGPQQPCLVSISQATLSPTEQADTRISFG